MAAAPILGAKPSQPALYAVTPQPGEPYGDGEPSEYAGPLKTVDPGRDLAQLALADIGYVHHDIAPAPTKSPKLYRDLGLHAIGNTPQVVRDRVNEAADSGAEEPAQQLREAHNELTRLRARADALSDNNSPAALDQLDLGSRISAYKAKVEQHKQELRQIELERQRVVASTMIWEAQASSTKFGRIWRQTQNVPAAVQVLTDALGERIPDLGTGIRSFSSTVGTFWENSRREARQAIDNTVSATIAYGVLCFVYGLGGIGWALNHAPDMRHLPGLARRNTALGREINGDPSHPTDNSQQLTKWLEQAETVHRTALTRTDLNDEDRPTPRTDPILRSNIRLLASARLHDISPVAQNHIQRAIQEAIEHPMAHAPEASTVPPVAAARKICSGLRQMYPDIDAAVTPAGSGLQTMVADVLRRVEGGSTDMERQLDVFAVLAGYFTKINGD